MALPELIRAARSYRRFDEARPVDPALLEACVDAARFVPSAANDQPLRYAIVTDPAVRAAVFPHLGWAKKLAGWSGPVEGERPAAYIVIAGDDRWPAGHTVDMGIAAQTLALLLAEAGVAACMLGSFSARAVRVAVQLPDGVKPLLVLAAGYPGETVVLDDLAPGGDTAYYRDAAGVHHVPKRRLDEVLIRRFC